MFSTHILDEALRRRKERLEGERMALLGRIVETLKAEGPRLGATEAFVVGSLTQQGQWTDESDVDVAASGCDPLEMMRVLEEASGRAVDVIDLGNHPRPEGFRRRGLRVL